MPPSSSADAMRLVIRCLAAGDITGPLCVLLTELRLRIGTIYAQISSCLESLVNFELVGTLNQFGKPRLRVTDQHSCVASGHACIQQHKHLPTEIAMQRWPAAARTSMPRHNQTDNRSTSKGGTQDRVQRMVLVRCTERQNRAYAP